MFVGASGMVLLMVLLYNFYQATLRPDNVQRRYVAS